MAYIFVSQKIFYFPGPCRIHTDISTVKFFIFPAPIYFLTLISLLSDNRGRGISTSQEATVREGLLEYNPNVAGVEAQATR